MKIIKSIDETITNFLIKLENRSAFDCWTDSRIYRNYGMILHLNAFKSFPIISVTLDCTPHVKYLMAFEPQENNVSFYDDFCGKSNFEELLDVCIACTEETYHGYEENYCRGAESVTKADVFSGYLLLKPEALGEQYRSFKYQLVKCKGGFGCEPTNTGKSVFCEWVIDGDRNQYARDDYYGVATEKCVEEWMNLYEDSCISCMS